MRTVICLPTYAERENLPGLVEAILTHVDASLMILDDNSPDRTGQAAERLASAEPRITVVHRSRKEGVGRAYREGLERAVQEGYDRIVQMDADGAHPPEKLPALLAGLDDADVTIGSRYAPGGIIDNWSSRQKTVSRLANLYGQSVLSLPIRDVTSGFVAWRRSALEAIDLPSVTSNGYAFQVELKYRAFRRGFTLTEMPIAFSEPPGRGLSKLGPGQAAHAVVRLLRLRVTGAF